MAKPKNEKKSKKDKEKNVKDRAVNDVAPEVIELGPVGSSGSVADPQEIVLPILPLRGTVVFPQTVVPLAAAQARSLRLIDEVMSGDRSVGVVLQHDAEQEGAGPGEVHQIGVIGTILQMMRVPDGSVRLAIQGNERMQVVDWVAEEPYLVAKVRRLPEDQTDSAEVQALSRNTLELFQRLVELVPHLPDELVTAALNIDDPQHLAYMVASNLRMEPEERQKLLEIDTLQEKLAYLNQFITKELDVLELGKRLQTEVQEELGKSQREYYLREQMKAIRRELGEESETDAEITELRQKVEAAGRSGARGAPRARPAQQAAAGCRRIWGHQDLSRLADRVALEQEHRG